MIVDCWLVMQMLDGFLDYASPKPTFPNFSYTLTKFVDFALCAAHIHRYVGRCGDMWDESGRGLFLSFPKEIPEQITNHPTNRQQSIALTQSVIRISAVKNAKIC